jgi:hypothetical protein
MGLSPFLQTVLKLLLVLLGRSGTLAAFHGRRALDGSRDNLGIHVGSAKIVNSAQRPVVTEPAAFDVLLVAVIIAQLARPLCR